jgi:Tol biopolymer transport system component
MLWGEALASHPCTLDQASGTTIDARPFLQEGYNTRWNFETDRIAFMQPDPKGYYHIYTMSPDGGERRAMPASEVSGGHQGQVYWHPSGRYLLFTAQKGDWSGRKLFGVPDYEAVPGFGRHDDLWLVTADGTTKWRLVDEANTKDEGILLPVFSPDGRRIAWSARQPGGHYVLKVADFVEAPQPHLQNIREFKPGGGNYFEPGSFSSDSRTLVYTSDQDSHSFWLSQIHSLDIATGRSRRLTKGSDYNEHPVVMTTPTGDWIVYMSTHGVQRRFGRFFIGTEWYAMRLDGTGQKRLTTMNTTDRTDPEYAGDLRVATTIAPSPSGTWMLGDVQDDLLKQTGRVIVVRLTCQ